MKKTFSVAVCVCIALAWLATQAVSAEVDKGPGRIHRIDIRAAHPRSYSPAIGDLVQCYMDFPIVPEQIVDDLRVSVNGNSISLVAVVSTSLPKIVGSGQISAFLLPRAVGDADVTMTAMIPGQDPKQYKMTFRVGVREAR